MNEDIKVFEERIIALDKGYDNVADGSEEQVNIAKAQAELAKAKSDLIRGWLDSIFRKPDLIVNAVGAVASVLVVVTNLVAVKEQGATNRGILEVEKDGVVTSQAMNKKFNLFRR